MFLLGLLSAVFLLLIAWFDFKDRSIPVVLLVVETGIVIIYFSLNNFPNYILWIGLNFLLGFFQVGMIAFGLRIKKKELSFFKEAFGWGDVFMMGIGAFFFIPIFYVMFVLLSTLFSLVYTWITRLLVKNNHSVFIPLAGIMAIILFIVQIIYFEEIIFLQVHNIYNFLSSGSP